MLYVGETKRTLRQRMNEHRRNVNRADEFGFLYEHFRSNGHCVDDMKFTILEKLADDASEMMRRPREDFWIRALVSAYPFGLNDKIDGYGIISKGVDPIQHRNHPYFSLKFPARRKIRGKRKRSVKKLNAQKIQQITDSLQSGNLTIRVMYCMLQSLSIRDIHYLYLQHKSGNVVLNKEISLLLYAVSACKFNIKQQFKPKRPEIFLPVEFPNKGMEYIKLHTILMDRTTRKLCKVPNAKLGDIKVSYRYKQPCGSKLFSHCQSLRNLDMVELKKEMQHQCMCTSSRFKYLPVGHVVTGDLNIIPDPKLQKIFQFGAKYRIPEAINWTDVHDACEQSFRQLMEKLTKKFAVPPADLEPCFNRCMQLAQSRIRFQQNHAVPSENYNGIEMGVAQWKCLRMLKKQFVIAPADKATSNFIFVCKKFYIETLCKELGIRQMADGTWAAAGNEVYRPIAGSITDIVEKHEDLCDLFGINIEEDDKVLPMIFAVPKLHKTPYKFRFIAGARKSSMKTLSVLLTRILTFMKEHFRQYCNKDRFHGPSSYWSVDSSLEALSKMKLVNNPRTITTADFSTLYTSLPHKLVFDELSGFINRMFANSRKEFLCVVYKKCFYSDATIRKCKCYTKQQVLHMIQIILDNTYVTFAGFIFQQISGIPMGGNASPLLADMTLSALEFKCINKMSNVSRKELGTCSRYIDDLFNLNGKDFLIKCASIYPACLPLEETTTSAKESNFLDMTIKLDGKTISATLYNKVDAFNFEVIRLPEFSSNVHSSVGYNTFYSQLVRIGRICSDMSEFEIKTRILCLAFLNKGYNNVKLLAMSTKFIQSYKTLVLNLGYQNNRQIMLLFKAIFV